MYRKTKIVATLGPASQSEARIEQLMIAGVNVFRLNFSHGSHDDHRQLVANIRQISDRLSLQVGILQDLQGPKIRVGRFSNGAVELVPGAQFKLFADKNKMGDEAGVGISYEQLYQDVAIGDELLLDDGKLSVQ